MPFKDFEINFQIFCSRYILSKQFFLLLPGLYTLLMTPAGLSQKRRGKGIKLARQARRGNHCHENKWKSGNTALSDGKYFNLRTTCPFFFATKKARENPGYCSFL